MFKLAIAAFAVSFVLISDAAAQCPGLFAPIMRTRVTVVHRHVYAPMVAVQAAPVVSVPVVEAPAPEIVAPAPPVTYYQQRTYLRAAPVVSADVVAVGVGSARAARKSAHHAGKSAEHAAKAAYWAARS